jgi:hypothetical protein
MGGLSLFPLNGLIHLKSAIECLSFYIIIKGWKHNEKLPIIQGLTLSDTSSSSSSISESGTAGALSHTCLDNLHFDVQFKIRR